MVMVTFHWASVDLREQIIEPLSLSSPVIIHNAPVYFGGK